MTYPVTSPAPSRATDKLPGGTRHAAIWSDRTAKVRLKLLATGAPVKDFTSSASDANASLRDGNALVASMAIFPADNDNVHWYSSRER
jgi:hypothetical protein